MTSQFCLLISLPYMEQMTLLTSNKPHTRQMNHSPQYKYKMLKSKYDFRILSCVCTDIVFLWDSCVRVPYHNRTNNEALLRFFLPGQLYWCTILGIQKEVQWMVGLTVLRASHSLVTSSPL
jgi:hypothetical protein